MSRAGVMPLSWSMDHLGPLTRTVAAAALLLEIPVGGLRVGVPENYYLDGIDCEMGAAVRTASSALEQLGVRVTPVGVPDPRPLTDVGTVDEVVGRMGRFSRLTRPINGLGLPALTVPCGFSSDGRPLALQIVGRAFDEATALRLGHAYQGATAWHVEPPRL